MKTTVINNLELSFELEIEQKNLGHIFNYVLCILQELPEVKISNYRKIISEILELHFQEYIIKTGASHIGIYNYNKDRILIIREISSETR